MKHFSLALAVVIFVSSVDCDRHKIVEKSLQRTGVECHQYNPPENCMARCQTLLTHDWNDMTGMQSVYDRFFQPSPVDRCNFNRTQRCLSAKLPKIAPEKKCIRASESIQCYLDQFGEVMVDIPKFVRSSGLQEQQIYRECATMMGFSKQRFLQVLNDTDYSLQDSRCLLRCFMIRSGLYSDNGGLNLERFYVACGGYDDEFYHNVTQCIKDVRASSTCDRCSLAHRLVMECIGSQYDVNKLNFYQYNDDVDQVNNYATFYLINVNLP
ncbi:general odorant-binding protein 45-like [Ochlerotatus camptorhynchus]|uniref:general odorant-binding protein 45-like n=1 Tax=Ochlerotatus camptorhynchus TaxID=644619 RepID=UPI0031D985C1